MFDLNLLLETFLPILKSNIGAFVFIPFYAVWVTALLPGVWMSMLAGALYGTLQGSILVFFGASLGAISAFLLGRTLLRNRIRRQLEAIPKLQSLIKVVSKEGLKLIILTRLSPAFPFSLLNFTYGLSEVQFRDYVIGLIGIIPGTILFCGLGNLAGEVAKFGEVLSNHNSNNMSILNIIGILATLLIVWLVNSALRRSLQDSDLFI